MRKQYDMAYKIEVCLAVESGTVSITGYESRNWDFLKHYLYMDEALPLATRKIFCWQWQYFIEAVNIAQ